MWHAFIGHVSAGTKLSIDLIKRGICLMLFMHEFGTLKIPVPGQYILRQLWRTQILIKTSGHQLSVKC